MTTPGRGKELTQVTAGDTGRDVCQFTQIRDRTKIISVGKRVRKGGG